MSPRTSSTRPSALRVGVGHRVISATTMSPGSASFLLLAGDHHVHDQPPIERDEIPCAGVVHFEAPDDGLGAALEDADDPPFGAILAALLDARDDPVAMHRLIEVGAGDEDVSRHALDAACRE